MLAVYVRVSGDSQSHASQEKDLREWADRQTEPVRWYRDKATGTTMDRPGLDALLADVHRGKVTRVVVWRLDRLGRTARGLLNLFADLDTHKCGFLSLRDAIDLSTPSGRLLLVVLSGVGAFETEVRSERQRAGIAAARASGKRWGGRTPGTVNRGTPEKRTAAKQLHAQGKTIAEISRVIGMGRQSVYRLLAQAEEATV